MRLLSIVGGLALAATTLLAAPASAHDRGDDYGRRHHHRGKPVLSIILNLGGSSRHSQWDRRDRRYRHSGWQRSDRYYDSRRDYRDQDYRDRRYRDRY
jgi:hypothetical protein